MMSQEKQNPIARPDQQTGDSPDTSEIYTDWKGQTYTTEEYRTRYQTDQAKATSPGETDTETDTDTNERSRYLVSGPTRLTARSTFPEADLSKLVQLFTNGSSLEIRLAALRNMGRFGQEVPPQLLFSGLCDPAPQVRSATIETIARLAKYQLILIPVIITRLHDTYPLVRMSAAWCLGHFGEAMPVQPLKDVIEEDTDTGVKAAALLALSKSSDSTVTKLFIGHLNDDHWQMREAAIEALSSNEEALPFSKLSNFVLSDENELVRMAAMDALAGRNSNVPSAVKTLRRIEHGESLQAFDPDGQELLRSSAAAAIEDIIESLLSVAQNSHAPKEQQWDALHNLATLGQLHYVAIESLLALSKDPWPAIRELATTALRTISKGIPISKAGSTFFGLTPAQLAPVSLLTFALDASYVVLLIQFLVGTTQQSSEQIRDFVQGVIRSEYIRALLNARTAVIPRESFYQNLVLFRDFLHDGESRDAFIALLATGAIVPYLHEAQRPGEKPEHEPPSGAFAAWRSICTSVEMQCLRLQWNKRPERDKQAFTNFDAQLCSLLAMINVKQAQQALMATGIPSDAEGLLEQQLQVLRRKVAGAQQPLSRADLHSVLIDITSATTQVEGNVPEQAAIVHNTLKQFVDLAYYKQLAHELHSPLLLPKGMMALSALQEEQDERAERHPKLLATLIELAGRPSPFSPVEAGMYVESLSRLSLADVLALRKNEAWERYMTVLEHMVQKKGEITLEQDAPRLHRAYVRLMQVVTQHLVDTLAPGQARNFRAYWLPTAAFEIEIGGAHVSLQWEQQGAVCRLSGRESPELSAHKTAPYSIALSIGQASTQRATADLSQTFIVAQGWLVNAKGEWQTLLVMLQEKVQQRVYQQEGVQSGSVLYL